MATNIELHEELLGGLEELSTSPPLTLPWGLPPNLSVAQAAKATRRSLNLSDTDPVPQVLHSLETAGIVVVPVGFDMTDVKHDAYTFWTGEFGERPVIFLRHIDSWERTRWSAAHELGHLVLHRHRERGDDDLEAEANAFANEFLVPGDQLRAEWPRVVTLSTLITLKMRWRMSLQSLIKHGEGLGLLDAERVSGLYKQLSARLDPETGQSWRRKEPGWSSESPERPQLLAAMFEAANNQPATAKRLARVAGGWAPDVLSGFDVNDVELSSTVVAVEPENIVGAVSIRSNVIAFGRRR
ncbi:MAG: ImmA/IrrE family metallo-endopeptidase [Nakamurella sp.]